MAAKKTPVEQAIERLRKTLGITVATVKTVFTRLDKQEKAIGDLATATDQSIKDLRKEVQDRLDIPFDPTPYDQMDSDLKAMK
jgi:hypothetical protein